MKPIAVVGSYNAGLTIKVGRLPSRGETILGTGYSEGHGGKGSNQAVAARRLGGRVGFVGCVGKDRFGDDAIELWRSEGISSEHVRRADVHTGLGFIVVDPSGNNAITVDPGANSLLGRGDIAAARDLLEGCGVLLLQLEIPPDTAAEAARMSKRSGATVIMNPAPAARAAELDLKSVDILTPNEAEFSILAGTDDIAEGSRRLLALGPKTVIVTLGDRGARVTTTDDSYLVPAPSVEAVDTTGAGDAFNGGLAVSLSEGDPLAAAVKFANYAGALTATRDGVVPALPTRRELDEFLRNDVLE